MDKLYRFLIVFGLVGYIIWFFQPYNVPEIYDGEVFNMLSGAGYGSVDINWDAISYISLVLYIFSAVGMWFYVNWARNLFLILTITSVVLTAIGGVSVATSIDSTLGYLTSLADGALLFMAYFSSISEKYENS